MELDKISANDFKPLLNKEINFKISHELNLASELIEVTELTGYSPLERKPFSIMFRTQQKNEYYNQGIFRIEHPQYGNIDLFLTPKGFDGVGMKYEAVFS